MYFLSVGMSCSCFEYLLGYGCPSSGSLIRDRKAIRDRVLPLWREGSYILMRHFVLRKIFVSGASHAKQSPSNPEVGTTTQEGRKRKRLATDGDEETYLQNQLIKTLERNGRMLSSQLEVQNTNFQLDREQRKDHGNSLIAVLSKLADALGRIADKL